MRRSVLQMAEVIVTRGMFEGVLAPIDGLYPSPGQ